MNSIRKKPVRKLLFLSLICLLALAAAMPASAANPKWKQLRKKYAEKKNTNRLIFVKYEGGTNANVPQENPQERNSLLEEVPEMQSICRTERTWQAALRRCKDTERNLQTDGRLRYKRKPGPQRIEVHKTEPLSVLVRRDGDLQYYGGFPRARTCTVKQRASALLQSGI